MFILSIGLRAQIVYWVLGLGQGRWFVRGQINSNEGVKLKIPWVRYKQKGWGRWFEEEYLLGWAKHKSKAYPVDQSGLPGGSTDRDVYYKRTRGMKAQRYPGKSCCHRIECSVTNFLAAFMWRKPLNSAALTIPTHKEPERVSDVTNTQVVAWMINKWRAKIIKKGIYNVRDPWRKGGGRIKKKNTVAIRNQTCNQASKAIRRNQSPRTLLRIFFLSVNLLSSFLCHQDMFTSCLIH